MSIQNNSMILPSTCTGGSSSSKEDSKGHDTTPHEAPEGGKQNLDMDFEEAHL